MLRTTHYHKSHDNTSLLNVLSSTTFGVKISIKTRCSVSHRIEILPAILARNLPPCVCVCVNSSVHQMEPVVPGSRAAAVPLCVVRAQCVLSAAVSNSQLTWQQHPRSFTAADGGELCCLRVRVFAQFFWRGSCGEAMLCPLLCPASCAGNKDEDNWNKTLEYERIRESMRPVKALLSLPIIQRGCGWFHLRVILEIISQHGGQWAYCFDLVVVIQLSTICNKQQRSLESCSGE